MGSDPQYARWPDLSLAQDIFTVKHTPQHRQNALKKLEDSITKHKMAPLYRYLAHPSEGILSGQISWNEDLYNNLKKENDEELEGFQKEEDEAAEKAGETEIQAARGKRAEFWSRVCDKVSKVLQNCAISFADKCL
jgi:26S proteasome regulatory subunit N7